MFFFERYLHQIISYDLINTFFYKNLKEIPKLKKITLNFGYQNSTFRRLVSSLLALEFITCKKGNLTISKDLNVFLKIKKGNPVGCKIILKKSTMYLFYLKLITSIFSKMKQSQTFRYQ
jgi:large subunit ribosomal protein L5